MRLGVEDEVLLVTEPVVLTDAAALAEDVVVSKLVGLGRRPMEPPGRTQHRTTLVR
jgi:hypothetical protein